MSYGSLSLPTPAGTTPNIVYLRKKIGATLLSQEFAQDLAVLWQVVVQQGCLEAFLASAGRDMELLALRIRTRNVHCSCEAQGNRNKILHLARSPGPRDQILGQLQSIPARAARMGADEIWHEVKLFAGLAAGSLETILELLEKVEARLAHER